MTKPRIRCTIVEVGCDDATADEMVARGGRRLLPWADPFIAQLVTKYRLRAALDDSLQFLRSEASHHTDDPHAGTPLLRPRGPRFNSPLPDSGETQIDAWPD